MKIAIQGEQGSWHDAATQVWHSGATIVPAEDFAETFDLVRRGEADSLLIAIENSLYGSIHQVYDLIESYGWPIIGEVHLQIEHCLISEDTLSDITHVYSHPIALAQCAKWLSTHLPNAKRVEYHDTAAAVEHIVGKPGAAAVASTHAAALHQATILQKNIEDNPNNLTRFLAVQPGAKPAASVDRASIMLVTDHTPGSLAKILTILASHNINLSKLQSRPIIGEPWKYKFYLVLDTSGKTLETALQEIKPHTTSLKILGQYHHHSS